MDIWSLGLISVFVLKGQSFWDLYTPFMEELSTMIDFSENHFNSTRLNVHVGREKEKSFIEDCLRLDQSARWSTSKLLKKSLFSIGQSTISMNAINTSTIIFNKPMELTRLISNLSQTQPQDQECNLATF